MRAALGQDGPHLLTEVNGMDRYPVLCDDELDAQNAELLPQRETLWSINVVNVIGVNLAFAINAGTINGSAYAYANQQLGAWVH